MREDIITELWFKNESKKSNIIKRETETIYRISVPALIEEFLSSENIAVDIGNSF